MRCREARGLRTRMRREDFIDSDLTGTEFQGYCGSRGWIDLGRGGIEGQIRQDLRRGHGAQCRNL